MKHWCLLILRKIKAGVISSVHSKAPHFPGWAGLVTTPDTTTGLQEGITWSQTAFWFLQLQTLWRLFEKLKLNGQRNISVRQWGLFPRICAKSWKTDALWEIFRRLAHALGSQLPSLSSFKLNAYMWIDSYSFFKPKWPDILLIISF